MRTLLVLGRVSNLPTVWSNCLAAWLLTGGGSWSRFSLVCLGATLLYTGGMFLNDAVDEGFDRRYRPERPIVSGRITSRTVWILSFSWLGTGWAIFLWLSPLAGLTAALLVGTIVLYDFVHKRTQLAPFLMAGCRFLLYVVTASVVKQATAPEVLWPAVVLAAYIIGLSYLARGESTGTRSWRWTIVLLFAPAVFSLRLLPNVSHALGWVWWIQIAWTLWSLKSPELKLLPVVPRGVGALLAGIALVDALNAANQGRAAVFVSFFVLALLLQRIAPAT